MSLTNRESAPSSQIDQSNDVGLIESILSADKKLTPPQIKHLRGQLKAVLSLLITTNDDHHAVAAQLSKNGGMSTDYAHKLIKKLVDANVAPNSNAETSS